jgi:hypothetical protein
MAVIYATGAGAGIQHMLWEMPGASRTILDAAFPYHQQALEDLLGRKPEKSCSQDTAILMAGAAYARAMEIAQKNGVTAPLIGLGLTGAVSTDRERRGSDRVHVALKTAENVFTEETEFDKGSVTRQYEGFFCDFLGLNMLLGAAGLDPVPMPGGFKPRFDPVLLDGFFTSIDDNLRELPLRLENGFGRATADLDPSKHVLYPGSYNPLHYGHVKVAREVERVSGKRVVYHITADHPSKGAIPIAEFGRRLRQFLGIGPALFTRGDSLYLEKARRFQGFEFVIGADAVLGLLDLKYYGGERSRLYAALAEFIALKTRFHVIGREMYGRFTELADLPIPPEFRHLFSAVHGRWDVSSSALRKA